MLVLVDCQVEEFGREGYLALAASGSPIFIALGGLLAILIGLTGYRLLLGDRLEMRDGMLLVVRIGFVLALATQWPAYQVVVYNLVLQGPGELEARLFSNAEAASASMVGRVQGAYTTLEALAYPAQLRPPVPPSAAPGSPAAIPALPVSPPISSLTIEERSRFSSAGLALLISSLAGMLSVRLVAALLLALGPMFIACALFRGLSGLFEGWVRGLAGAFVGSIAVTVVLATELAILEPQVIALLQALDAPSAPTGAADQILATTLLFGIVMFAVLVGAARVGAGFRLPATAMVIRQAWNPPSTMQPKDHAKLHTLERRLAPEAFAPSRASQIVDALKVVERRDSVQTSAASRLPMIPSPATRNELSRTPLGQSQRRALSRGSAAADRRDQKV